MEQQKVLLGTKYQTYIDDELIIFRLIGFKNESKFIMLDKNNNKINMTKDDLDKFVKLDPDAFLNIMTTTTKDGLTDVYACINRCIDLLRGDTNPTLVLRQNTFSTTKNAFGQLGSAFMMGECLTVVNAPENYELKSLFEFDDITKSLSIALYVDDKLEDIFNCIPKKQLKIFDEELKSIKDTFDRGNANRYDIQGYCTSLKQLFEENNFIFNFRNIYNIVQVNFKMDNVSDDGVVNVSKEQIDFIQNLIRKYIMNVNALKYDKDIDVSKLTDKSHLLLSDSDEDIYLITYDEIEDFPVDDDIAKAMGL